VIPFTRSLRRLKLSFRRDRETQDAESFHTYLFFALAGKTVDMIQIRTVKGEVI
jgi:hypothetical protein